MALLGASPEQIAAMVPPRAEFELWPQHQAAVEAFFHVCHQWRFGPNGRLMALDYPQVEAGWRLAGVTVSQIDWQKIRMIESEVIQLAKEDD